MKLIQLPLKGILKIWKYCYVDNTDSVRDKLDELDLTVTNRKIIMKDGEEFVQFTQAELVWIKNLYEQVI